VLVDATIIRTFVVPAVMALGGRLNWYPGRPRRRTDGTPERAPARNPR
jgi:uncharacterized membrane protein YdfJ with MMPL/SSD domain